MKQTFSKNQLAKLDKNPELLKNLLSWKETIRKESGVTPNRIEYNGVVMSLDEVLKKLRKNSNVST